MAEKKRGLRNTRVWKRFAAICMAVVMAVTMLPIIPGAKDVYAAQVDGDTISVTINFKQFDLENPHTPNISYEGNDQTAQNYHVVATLYKKGTKDVAGYGFVIVNNLNQATQTVEIKNFYTTDEEDYQENPWSPVKKKTSWTDLDGGYDPAKYDVSLRLLYGDSPAYVTKQQTYWPYGTEVVAYGASYNNLMGQTSTIDGYLFSGSSVTGYNGEITLFKGHNAYEVEFVFDPEAGTITDQDNFYLLATGTHQSTETSYYVTKITSDGTSEKLVYKVENPDWTNINGVSQDEKYSTSWTVDVQIRQAEEGEAPTQSQIINGNLIVNKDVKVLNGYTVTVDPTLQKQRDLNTETEYVKQVINLSKVKTSKDYTLFDILGDSLYYGLTAPEITQRHHSETNLATKVYSNPNNANYMEPDLSGIGDKQVPGTFLIGEIKSGESLQFGNETPKTPVVIVGNGCESQVTSSQPNVAVAVGADKASINAKVDSMINHMLTVSADLAAQAPTDVNINIVGEELRIDTTSLPDGATIYIDGDKYASYIAKGEVLKIKKNPKQIIVFNFKSTKDVVIGKAHVDNGDGMKSTETVNQEYKNPKNINADQVAQGLVWNVTNMDPNATFKQDKAGGMFLLPNPKVTADIGNASCGWVISAAPFEILNGEFHFVYRGLKPEGVSSVLLQAFKTVDGVDATEDQKFEFSLYRFDGTDFVPVEIQVVDIDGQPTGTTTPYKVVNNKNRINFAASNMQKGDNVFLIKETKKAEDTDGAYKLDSTKEIYATFNVIVKDLDGTQVKVPGVVKYYGSFDPATGQFSDELDADGCTFKNTTLTDTAKLTLTKSFGGAVVASDLETLSFEVQKKDGTVVATFALKDTDVFEKQNDGSYKMKEAYELEVGDYNIVETNYDASGAKVSVSYSVGAGSTDYKTDGTASQGNYTVAQTFAKDDDVVLNFKNQYPSTNVKLSKQNLGGEEIEGASLTLTGTVGTGTTPVKFTTDQVAQGAGVKDLAVSADGKTLSWISGTTLTTVNNLPNGKYTLHEVSAPTGYAVANDFKFVVKDNKVYKEDGTTEINENKVILIDNGSTDVVISKVMAGTTTELAGATLELTGRKADGSGAITFDLDNVKFGTGAKDEALSESDTKVSWVSGTGATTVEKLPNGIYTLTEMTAPQGFSKSEKISFILENGKVYENNAGVKGAEITDKKITMEDAFLPIEVQIAAKKTLENDTLVKDQFSFNLKGTSSATNNIDETVGNAADGSVTFTEISYNSVGKYEYKLTEVKPATPDPDITYSAEEYTVTVDVTATATGLAAKVTYTNKAKAEVEADKVEFVNTKKTEVLTDVIFSKVIAGTTTELAGATLTLTGTKPGSTDAITFKIADVETGTGASLKTTADGTSIEWISGTGATKVKNLPNGTYTLTETTAPQGFDKSEAISFIIEDGKVYENKNGTKGTEITDKKITMEDAYTPVKVQLTAKKTLQNDTLTANQFSFHLKGKTPDTNTVDETVGNAANGDVTFTEIAYSAVGTYTYELTEVEPATKDPNITYSDRVYTITVTVSATDTGLKTTIAYADQDGVVDAIKPEFVNVKKTESKTDVRISKKAGTAAGPELAGATLKLTGVKKGSTDKVTFKVSDVVEGTGAKIETKTDGDELKWISGTTETEIKNLPDGTYTLHEVTAPDANGFKVANDMYFILENGEVYASDAQGTKGSKIGNSTIVMVDEYQPIDVNIVAKKVFTNGTLTAGQFSFNLKGTAPVENTVDDTKTNVANGDVTFDTLSFSKEGTYTYKLTEVKPQTADPLITYSEEEYTATVTVTATATGLQAAVSYADKNGTGVNTTKPEFTNVKRDEPKTDVKISKKAGTTAGAELAGATLTLTGVKAGSTDKVTFKLTDVQLGNGASFVSTVDGDTLSWISGTTSTEIKNLPDGTYTLHEVTAPNANGFKIANDMYFILENGEVYASDAQGTKGSKIDNSTIVMVDEYQPISVDLAATKKLMEGNTEIAQTAGDFQFKLSKKADSGVIQTSSNAADGTVTFTSISYNAPTEDEYVIEEVPGNIADITYDTKTKYTVTVKITAGAKGLEKEVIYNNGTSDVDADKVVFTNMKAPDVGKLKIKKTVKGTTLDSVKVMITTGQGASQKYLTLSGTLVDAETHITVSTKDGLTIENVPVGEYTVTEVADSTIVANYTLVTTGADGSKTTETKIVEKGKLTEVELINSYERDKGQLTVTKTLIGSDIPKTVFKITIMNGTKYLNASGTLVDQDPGLTITANVPLQISNVPTGSYTVTENVTDAQVKGYTLTANGSVTATVTKGQTRTAALTNEYTRDLGSLEITKSFLGDKPADNLLTGLTFKVTGPDSFERELAYPTAFTNGKATLTDLPTGEYSVVESGTGNVVDGTTTYIYDVAGSSTTVGPKNVTKGGTAQVTITNKYTKVEKGSLTVTKSVTVNGGAPAVIAAKAEDKAYQVQIKNEAGKFINAAGEAVENDPGLTVSRTASITINDLPLGKYSISEVSADVNNVDATLTLDTASSTTGYTGATAVELTSAAKDATKQLVNVYTYQQPKPDTYKVYISKADALSGDEIAGATIELTKPDQTKVTWTSTTTAKALDLEEGTYSFVETVEPNGYEKVTTAVEFKVEKDETVAAGYKVTLITVSGDVEQKADGTIVLLDAPKKGSLAITKKVSSDTGNVPAKDSFKVTVYNETKQLYVTDAQGTTSATKTTIDVPLAGLTINNIPLGEYVVEEDTNDAANVTGFSFDKESSTFATRTEVKVDAANTVVNGKADLENIYTEVKGALKIKKTVGGDKTSKTSFKVTVQNAAGKYVKADGTLSDTAVLLDVKVDGGLTINNLLAGKYTITEDTADINVDGYDRTGGVTTTEATVVKGTTTEAELVNNYKKKDTGKISVHVTEEKSGLDVPDATVVVTDQNGKKTTYKTNEKGEVVDKDGKIPTVPSGEYTITVSDVPTGYDVKTGEVGKVVVPKDGEGHHEAVIATDLGGIIITVYDEETNEVVSGAKVVIKTPSGEEKEFVTDENGQITEYAKKDQFGNYTSEVGEYKYTVTEVPEGYRVTTGKEQTGKVETSKLTELEAKIAPKTGGLDIKVIDQKTKQPVPNATVEVTYPDGTVHEFKTDKDGMIRDLAEKKNGKYTAKVGTYKIKVTKVPEGYSVQTGVETTETIEVDTLKHHVAEIATATEKTVQTGDDTPITLLIMLMLMSAAGAAYVVIRKRREN